MDQYDFYESLNRLYYNDKKTKTPPRKLLPTDDNFGVEFMRELTIMRIKFPFLTELQLQGRTLTKFGIPNIMGKPYEKKKRGSIKFCTVSHVIHKSRKSLSEKKSYIDKVQRRHTIAGTYVPLDVRNTKYQMKKNSRVVKNLYSEFTLYSEEMDNDRYSIDPATSPEIKSHDFSEGSQHSDLNLSIDSESPEMVKPVKTYEKRKSFDNNRNYISSKNLQNLRKCDTGLTRMLPIIDKPMRSVGQLCVSIQRSCGNYDEINEINHINAEKISNKTEGTSQKLNKIPSRNNSIEQMEPMMLESQNEKGITYEENIDAENRQIIDLNFSRFMGGKLSAQSDEHLSIDNGEPENLQTQDIVSASEISMVEPSEETANVTESSLVDNIRVNFKRMQLSLKSSEGYENQSDIEPTPSSRHAKNSISCINLRQSIPVKKIKQSMSMVSMEYLERVFNDRSNPINCDSLNLSIEYLYGIKCLPTPNLDKRMMKIDQSGCDLLNPEDGDNLVTETSAMENLTQLKAHEKFTDTIDKIQKCPTTESMVLSHGKILQRERSEEYYHRGHIDAEYPISKVKKHRKSSINAIETIEDRESTYSEDSTQNEEHTDLDEYEDTVTSPKRRRKSSCSSVEVDYSRNQQAFSPNQIQPNLSQDSTSSSSEGESDDTEHLDSEEESNGSGDVRGQFSPRIVSFENHMDDSSVASTLRNTQDGDESPHEGHNIDTMNPINNQITDDGYFLANLFDDHTSQPQRRTLRSTSMREIPSSQENDGALVVE